MPGIAVKQLDEAGGAQTAQPGNDWVIVENQPVVVVGSRVEPHPLLPPHTTGPPMVAGVGWFTIDGIPVCRAGDAAECGHTTTGRDWFQIDG